MEQVIEAVLATSAAFLTVGCLIYILWRVRQIIDGSTRSMERRELAELLEDPDFIYDSEQEADAVMHFINREEYGAALDLLRMRRD